MRRNKVSPVESFLIEFYGTHLLRWRWRWGMSRHRTKTVPWMEHSACADDTHTHTKLPDLCYDIRTRHTKIMPFLPNVDCRAHWLNVAVFLETEGESRERERREKKMFFNLSLTLFSSMVKSWKTAWPPLHELFILLYSFFPARCWRRTSCIIRWLANSSASHKNNNNNHRHQWWHPCILLDSAQCSWMELNVRLSPHTDCTTIQKCLSFYQWIARMNFISESSTNGKGDEDAEDKKIAHFAHAFTISYWIWYWIQLSQQRTCV